MDEVQRRFERRYALGLWCAVIPFFGFFAAGVAVAKSQGNIFFFALGWALGLTLLVYVGLVYRCPRCGAVPVSSKTGTSGVLLVPKRCARCKSTLLGERRWAQD